MRSALARSITLQMLAHAAFNPSWSTLTPITRHHLIVTLHALWPRALRALPPLPTFLSLPPSSTLLPCGPPAPGGMLLGPLAEAVQAATPSPSAPHGGCASLLLRSLAGLSNGLPAALAALTAPLCVLLAPGLGSRSPLGLCPECSRSCCCCCSKRSAKAARRAEPLAVLARRLVAVLACRNAHRVAAGGLCSRGHAQQQRQQQVARSRG